MSNKDIVFSVEDLKYLDMEEMRTIEQMKESIDNLKKMSNKKFCRRCGHIMSAYKPRHMIVYVCGYCLNTEK